MDPISNVDAIILLLRRRLLERSRSDAPRRADEAAPARESPAPSRTDTLHALAAVQDIDDRTLGRALVQSVLAEHFGDRHVNEPKFQQVVDRVSEAIEEQPEAAKLLQRIMGEFRATER